MPLIRVNKTSDYTVMSNAHLREAKMSLKAKGLLSIMLSLPDEWDYSVSGLVSICKENETAIKSTLNELKSFGYLRVIKFMPNETESGRIEYVYEIYEQPQKQEGGFLGLESEKQEGDFLPLENQGQLNTNRLNIPPLKVPTGDHAKDVAEIVNHLNEKTGSSFKASTASTRKQIGARLKEGYTVEDCKRVIDDRVKEWTGTKWEQYLRPSTLFAPSKFEGYLNAAPKDKQPDDWRKEFNFYDGG